MIIKSLHGEVFFIKYIGFLFIAVLIYMVTSGFQQIYEFSSFWLVALNALALGYFAYLMDLPILRGSKDNAAN